jgi:hypothetical protein
VVRWFVAIGVLGVMVVAGWLFISEPARFLTVGGDELASSLSRETPNGKGGECTRQREAGWWWCGVELDPGSGYGQMYRLTSDDDGCWTARRAKVETIKSPKSRFVRVVASGEPLSACVGILDYVSPDDPALGSDGGPGQLPLRPE